jgi:hypothetical protein
MAAEYSAIFASSEVALKGDKLTIDEHGCRGATILGGLITAGLEAGVQNRKHN